VIAACPTATQSPDETDTWVGHTQCRSVPSIRLAVRIEGTQERSGLSHYRRGPLSHAVTIGAHGDPGSSATSQAHRDNPNRSGGWRRFSPMIDAKLAKLKQTITCVGPIGAARMTPVKVVKANAGKNILWTSYGAIPRLEADGGGRRGPAKPRSEEARVQRRGNDLAIITWPRGACFGTLAVRGDRLWDYHPLALRQIGPRRLVRSSSTSCRQRPISRRTVWASEHRSSAERP